MYAPQHGLLAAAVIVAALATAPATSAKSEPVGSCPQGFVLIPLKHVPQLAFLDRNGDEWLCSKPLLSYPTQPAYQVIDNDVQQGVPTEPRSDAP